MLDKISITRPSAVRWSSSGRRSAFHAVPVTSNKAPRRLEVVSSGPITRKLRVARLHFITSRRKVPITRVDSARVDPGVIEGGGGEEEGEGVGGEGSAG